MQVEHDSESIILRFLDLVQDGNSRTIDGIARELNASRELVEKLSNLFSGCGLIKYRRVEGVVKGVCRN